MTTATYTGNVELHQVSIRLSDRFGNGSSAHYSFVLTNGDGDVYGTVENTLNFYKDTSASTIEASVLASLSVGIATLAGTDSSIDLQEFAVEFSGDQLIITNSQGRALAVEDFSSTHGFLTVTPINEPGAAEVLASQNAYYSELRVQLNTSTFGTDLSATERTIFVYS